MAIDRLLDQAFRLQGRGAFAQAEKLYSQALQTVRDNPALWFNHGLVLRDLGQPQRALASFDQALRLAPSAPEIQNERAGALLALGQHEAALAALDRSLALKPANPGALINRGLVLMALEFPEGSLTDFDTALRLDPGLALAHVNRGAALEKLGRPAEALAAYGHALALDPNDCGALNQRGYLLTLAGRHAEGLADYDRALDIDPGLAAVRFNRATALLALKRVAEAHAEMQRLFAEQPGYPFAFDGLLDTALRTCDFAQREKLEKDLPAHIRAQRPLTPFNLLMVSDDAPLQRAAAANYTRGQVGHGVTPLPPRRVAAGGRLKIAYLSHDFREHTVAASNAAMLERHDRERFEFFAVSTGPDDASPMRRRLQQAFEHFLDVRERSDGAVAQLLREVQIDILVDLNGHTTGARPGVLARRPAPIQASYQGYPGTLGGGLTDYLIADAVVIPPGRDGDFAEKIVRLPHCYMPADPTRHPSQGAVSRAAADLPQEAFVFCAFNSVWKIAPPAFQVWMTLLRAVPGSILWLRHDNDAAVRHLRQQAAAAGIEPERLVFAPRADDADHVARHRLADLFLDTAPFTGHSTAIESLWAGLPLVSCAGTGFASRVSASALAAVGMPELAVTSWPDYQALALKLARDPALLAGYRARLEAGRQTFPLFDATGLARALEAAYLRMADLARAGKAPEAFRVAAD
jgi:predicted O-linked N-acetylglucosamine transferase (SPINDLY family)